MTRQQRLGTLIFLLLCAGCLGVVILRNRYAAPPVDKEAEALINQRLESLRLAPASERSDTIRHHRKHKPSKTGTPKKQSAKRPTPAPPTPRSPLDEPIPAR